jgi:hypothetical protein
MSSDRYAHDVGDLTIENGIPAPTATPLEDADAFARRTAAARGGDRIAATMLMHELIAKQAATIVQLADESAKARLEAIDRQVEQRLEDFKVFRATLDSVEESAYQSAHRALSERAQFFQALRTPTAPPRGPADVFEAVFKEVIGAVKDVVTKNPALLSRLGSAVLGAGEEAEPAQEQADEAAPAQEAARNSEAERVPTLRELVEGVEKIPKFNRKHQKDTQDLTIAELHECLAAAEAANVER